MATNSGRTKAGEAGEGVILLTMESVYVMAAIERPGDWQSVVLTSLGEQSDESANGVTDSTGRGHTCRC